MTAVGGVDVLVHVVGGSSAPAGGFRVIENEHWEQELQLNLLAAVRLDRTLLPPMIAAGGGAVVHISSIQRRPRFKSSWPPSAASPSGDHANPRRSPSSWPSS